MKEKIVYLKLEEVKFFATILGNVKAKYGTGQLLQILQDRLKNIVEIDLPDRDKPAKGKRKRKNGDAKKEH